MKFQFFQVAYGPWCWCYTFNPTANLNKYYNLFCLISDNHSQVIPYIRKKGWTTAKTRCQVPGRLRWIPQKLQEDWQSYGQWLIPGDRAVSQAPYPTGSGWSTCSSLLHVLPFRRGGGMLLACWTLHQKSILNLKFPLFVVLLIFEENTSFRRRYKLWQTPIVIYLCKLFCREC